MDRIDDHVYLSNAKTANKGEELLQWGITRVLTVDIKPVKRKHQDIQYYFVHMEDDPNWDLLSSLKECLAYIESAVIEGNAILVHCFLGISRSPAVATAYLMRRYKVDADEALRRIRSCRPIVCPNEGFLRQLRLFHVNSWCTDNVSSAVTPFLIKTVNSYVENGAASSNSHEGGNLSDQSGESHSVPSSVLFRCRGCRRPLFTNAALLEHTSSADAEKSTTAHGPCSLSNFVNPVEWMNESIASQQGKVSEANSTSSVVMRSPITFVRCSYFVLVVPQDWGHSDGQVCSVAAANGLSPALASKNVKLIQSHSKGNLMYNNSNALFVSLCRVSKRCFQNCASTYQLYAKSVKP
ncbi:hypothetical protein D918_07685 [Trichuris suis]|nr:hypothetical protein D918_07685 [Trichuris suis]